MKKLIFSLLILATPAVMFAQLKVLSDGSTQVGDVAESDAQFVSSAITANGKTYGVYGMSAKSSGLAIGVLGESCCGGTGFGTAGVVPNNMHGAGIYGAVSSLLMPTSGSWAGYFSGNVFINGGSVVYSLNNISDIRLKDNIHLMSTQRRQGETLNNILGMNVLEYTFKEHEVEAMEKGEDGNLVKRNIMQKPVDDKLHFGLSAQDLQEIYPNLVTEGQDGYLSVNYIELVPVLIQAIQELKQELDEVKGVSNARKAANTTGIDGATSFGNVLYQNTPNPFKEQTVIRFQLAGDAQNAAICIFDMTGKMLKKLSVSQGMESVSIAGYELGEGMFLYTLMVNGQEIDTKRMIITK